MEKIWSMYSHQDKVYIQRGIMVHTKRNQELLWQLLLSLEWRGLALSLDSTLTPESLKELIIQTSESIPALEGKSIGGRVNAKSGGKYLTNN